MKNKNINSYKEILKASIIMGGASSIVMLFGMLRTKIAAIFIGASGVGLNAGFTSIQTLIGTIVSFGIHFSAVREIASAISKENQKEVDELICTIDRLSIFSGIIALAITIILGEWISKITFGESTYSLDVTLLGFAILIANISAGKMAILQGFRYLKHIAKINIYSAGIGAAASILMYPTLKEESIVPIIIMISVAQLILSHSYTKQIRKSHTTLPINEIFRHGRRLARLGLLMTINSLLGSCITYFAIAIVTSSHGIKSVGFYSAALMLSGVFINFILNAMATEYYPRLSASVNNKQEIKKIVNDQTEIAVILATPGLIATIGLAPWIIQIFYTKEFEPSIILLQLFVIGCFGRVLSWPISYQMLATGNEKTFFLIELGEKALHATLMYSFLMIFGLNGMGLAFICVFIYYVPAMYKASNSLSQFSWSHDTKKTLIKNGIIILTSFAITKTMDTLYSSILCVLLSFLTGINAYKIIRSNISK